MKKTILVCGHGPGISNAVAHCFGNEGWNVAIATLDPAEIAAKFWELEQKRTEGTVTFG